MQISRYDIEKEPHRWFHYVLNGEDVYREYPQHGNRDARFRPVGSMIGDVHIDQYNAISQPISHIAHWLHEKTGINEKLLRVFGYGLTGYIGYRLLK